MATAHMISTMQRAHTFEDVSSMGEAQRIASETSQTQITLIETDEGETEIWYRGVRLYHDSPDEPFVGGDIIHEYMGDDVYAEDESEAEQAHREFDILNDWEQHE